MNITPPSHQLCPLQVEILMHYYATLGSYPGSSKMAKDYLGEFINRGILDSTSAPFKLTDKGRAWVEAILCTPCPKPVWVTTDGTVIDLTPETPDGA